MRVDGTMFVSFRCRLPVFSLDTGVFGNCMNQLNTKFRWRINFAFEA